MLSLQVLVRASLCCAAAITVAFGQTTFATITGAVTDPNGLVVPGATIEATHVQSNYQYRAQTNAAGVYTVGQLREGSYAVRITVAGFKEFVVQGVELNARDIRRVDAHLELSAVQATVEVTSGGATLIETETARITEVKGQEQLQSLPLATRSAMDFIQQTPGVLRRTGSGWSIRFAGSRPNQEDQTIDGISFNNGRDDTYIGVLGGFMESVAEVRIDMANNTAEVGSLGQFTLISRSGTNRLHGAVFDYYSSSGMNARNPFSPTRASLVEHQPGASVGGPVVLPKLYNGRDKTFFFFTFEGRRGGAVSELLTPTVALANWRSGDFSGLLPKTVIQDPLSKQALPGNRIPAARISSVSQKLQGRFWPLPNYGDTSVLQGQNYREVKTRPYDLITMVAVRLDHRFSEKSFLYGRYTWARQYTSPFEGGLPTIGTRWNPRTTPALNVSYSYMLRPTLVNEVRGGFTFNDNPRHGPLMGLALVKDLGLVGLADNLPDIPGVLNVSFSGIGLTGITQQVLKDPGFRNRVYQLQDHLSWYRGRHTIKAGFLLGRIGFADRTASGSLFGNVSFSNRFTGHPYADFLLGIPTTASRDFPPQLGDVLRRTYEFFFTDELKLTPRLTLNLGVRYERHPPWASQNGLASVFDLGSGRIVVPDGMLKEVSPLMPRGYVEVIEAREVGLPGRTLLRTDGNNFAPRAGVAFRPWGNRTVFRTGFGIYYDVVPRPTNEGGPPFAVSEPAFTNPMDAPVVIFPRVFPASSSGLTTVSLPTALRADLRTPYSMQYSFTIEHQRWSNGLRLSYTGTNTRQGEWAYNANQPVPDLGLFVDKPRRFPSYPSVTYLTNGAGHQYHAMTAAIRRPMARGLSYQFSYELSRDIGDLERGGAPEDAYDRRRERSVSQHMPTHRIIGNVIYQLPFGSGKSLLSGGGRLSRSLASNWEISAIYDLYSGQFLTPQWTGTDPTGTAYTASRTPAQVTRRPNHLRDANLPEDQRTTNRWFDPDAFAPPTPGFFGTSAKGVIKGPGVSVLHAGIAKQFAFSDRLSLRLQMQATNVLNHPNWSNPGTNISSVSVARISGVGEFLENDRAGPRRVLLGMRLEW